MRNNRIIYCPRPPRGTCYFTGQTDRLKCKCVLLTYTYPIFYNFVTFSSFAYLCFHYLSNTFSVRWSFKKRLHDIVTLYCLFFLLTEETGKQEEADGSSFASSSSILFFLSLLFLICSLLVFLLSFLFHL